MTQIYFEIQNNQQIFTFPWLNYSDNCRGHVIYPHIYNITGSATCNVI